VYIENGGLIGDLANSQFRVSIKRGHSSRNGHSVLWTEYGTLTGQGSVQYRVRDDSDFPILCTY
jgi:hypothetical protein